MDFESKLKELIGELNYQLVMTNTIISQQNEKIKELEKKLETTKTSKSKKKD